MSAVSPPAPRNKSPALGCVIRLTGSLSQHNNVARSLPRAELPDGTVVLSNRFGHGPFKDFQRYVLVVPPQGVEIEGIYEAAHRIHPPRYWFHASALHDGQRSHAIWMRLAPTEQGAKAMIASLARTIEA